MYVCIVSFSIVAVIHLLFVYASHMLDGKKKIVKRNSLFFFFFFFSLSASAVSRYSKQFQFSYSLFCSCQYYQHERDVEARNIWILKDFFFVRFSLSLSTLFHPSNTLGFFYITYYSANNTSLNKRRSAMHIKKEISRFFSIIYYTHIYIYI